MCFLNGANHPNLAKTEVSGGIGHSLLNTEQSPWQTWTLGYPIRANPLSLDINLDIQRLMRKM